MTAMFDELLKFLVAQPGVWFPGHNKMAEWIMSQTDDEHTYAKRFFA
jgi:hypothetical protein